MLMRGPWPLRFARGSKDLSRANRAGADNKTVAKLGEDSETHFERGNGKGARRLEVSAKNVSDLVAPIHDDN
jgi:hypothetical protein